MTDTRERRRKALDRAPMLLLFGILWVPLTLLVGLPMRWLFDRQEPWDTALLHAAFTIASLLPAMFLARLTTAGYQRARDPDGHQLQRAVRHGRLPDDDRPRAELPAHLARRRRGTLLALALILPVCAGLVLLALLVVGSAGWALVHGVVAVACAGVAVLTLTRVRRLERLLPPPGQGG